ncbi:type II secretion system F family protein [Candidatus Kuenenbacteria bacterium]|nr:type II secretion system F family protein [Candidatus Kuenenbacteria bacterium]
MSLYNYRAKTTENDEMLEGVVEAESESLAVDILEDKGYIVLSLEQKKTGLAALEISFDRVKIKDLVIFSRQLSILISAEVPVVEALKDAVGQTNNPKLKKTIAEVASEVEGGVKFSEALAHFPKVFDGFFINIIKSGEVSGRLQEVLVYLADQLEKDYDLRAKIKGAMIYPVFVICGLVVVGVLMMIFVVPKLTEMLTQTGAKLPFTTRMLIGTSDFLIGYWWVLIIVVAVFGFVVYKVNESSAGKRVIDKVALKLPVFGKLINYTAVIRFSRSFRTLLIGGVDMVEALEISSGMMSNTVYEDLILETVNVVKDGGELGLVFSKSKYAPKMLSQMLETGENTGKVKEVLEKVSEFYTREANNLIANLMALLEPFIMIILGVAVGAMIISIILPMYEISSNM